MSGQGDAAGTRQPRRAPLKGRSITAAEKKAIAAVRRAAKARDWKTRIDALNDAIEALGLSTLPRDAK